MSKNGRLTTGRGKRRGRASCPEFTALVRCPEDGGQLVDFHLERGLRLHTKPKHKNLYKWAINEIDPQGKQIGDDQIPWPWTFYFTATSCVLSDRFEIKSQSAPAPNGVVQRQVIRVTLRPGSPQWSSGRSVMRRIWIGGASMPA